MTTTPEVLLPELPSYFTPGSTAEAQMHDYARAAIALNRRAGVPEGWELVPREPTAAMLNAAACTPHDNTPTGGGGHPFRINMARKEYAALLAAAPQPPAACDTCRGRGEIGGWRQGEGYNTDPCPDCSAQPPVAQPEPGAVRDYFQSWLETSDWANGSSTLKAAAEDAWQAALSARSVQGEDHGHD